MRSLPIPIERPLPGGESGSTKDRNWPMLDMVAGRQGPTAVLNDVLSTSAERTFGASTPLSQTA